MKPITLDELASIAREAVNACDTPCEIWRNANPVAEADGGTVTTPTLVTATVCGLRQPSMSQLQNFGYLVGTRATWLVVFPLGTDVQELDTVRIAASPPVGPQELHVVKLLQPSSFSSLYSVIANEVK